MIISELSNYLEYKDGINFKFLEIIIEIMTMRTV